MKTIKLFLMILVCGLESAIHGLAAPVNLQNSTATFSQSYVGDFSVQTAINGTTADSLGWSIYPETGPQVAVFETTTNVGFPGGSILTFTMNHAYAAWGQHIIGRFRLSVTTDDRSTFANGLPSGGDVTANWVVLDATSFTSSGGATLSKLGDLSILATGQLPDMDIYTVTARTDLTNITGLRLEALTDPTLPNGRPGRQQDTGNFILSEFTVTITPDAVPPTIQRHPASQIGYWGKSVTFDLLASGSVPLIYQWQKDGAFITGANDPWLVLTNLQMSDGGSYAVVLSNVRGSITSNPAILTMNPAGVSIALYPGVTIEGTVGLTYGIQTTTNLSDPNGWRGANNLTLDTPVRLWFDTQPATQPRRYYRVVPGPIPVP